jgi:hypothetical protein
MVEGVKRGYNSPRRREQATETRREILETKSGVLRALWNLLLRDGEEDVPVAEQEWYRTVLEEADPERQLRLNARNSSAGKVRIGAILEVISTAAPTDSEIDALWNRIQTDYHANQKAIVVSLREKNALHPALSVERATDILWTINHPAVWHLLVRERGWTPKQYEQWSGDVARGQLLRSAPIT